MNASSFGMKRVPWKFGDPKNSVVFRPVALIASEKIDRSGLA